MSVYGGDLGLLAWAILLAGFGYAAYTDVRTREAPDGVWLVLGGSGAALGAAAVAPGGPGPVVAWLLVAGLILQHFVPWDRPIERLHESLPGYLELAAYVGVGAVLVGGAFEYGISGSTVPGVAIAGYSVVVIARAAFEFGLLYGGADAKALIAAAALIPLSPSVLADGATAVRLEGIVPGPLTLLMNAALLSVAVPIAIAIRNLKDGTFEGGASFLGYPIPVAELPRRFVWLRDPLLGGLSEEEREVETSEDDRRLRERQRSELEARGVVRVWVTPQLPFLVFFLAGAVVTFLIGNLLFDVLASI